MKFVYLKGNDIPNELEEVRKSFGDLGDGVINLVDNYASFIGMSDEAIADTLATQMNELDDDICLLSSGIGCNYALLAAPQVDNMIEMVFVAPLWFKEKKEDKFKVVSTEGINIKQDIKKALSLNGILNSIMNLRSRKWVSGLDYYFTNFTGVNKFITCTPSSKGFTEDTIKHLMSYENTEVQTPDVPNNPFLNIKGVVGLPSVKKAGRNR